MSTQINSLMNIKKLDVPEGVKYLGEFFKEGLPDNVILNKGITGCGATTSAIMEERKYVIAMPYISLIVNKKQDCEKYGKEYLTVYSGVHTEEDVKSFSGSKILVTYNSLPKVIEALGDSVTEWKIMVDECHKIIDDAAFRPEVMQSVLDSYHKFGSYIFTTATPIPSDGQLAELNGLPHVQLQWKNVTPVKVNYTPIEQKDLHGKVAYQLKQHHVGKIAGRAHIFINSVKDIVRIAEILIKLVGVDKNDIAVTCADGGKNKKKLSSLGLDIVPAGVSEAKFNFYTSTAFEGCDIFDETGHTYIVTDGQRDHTKVAIETSLPQIIGRVRDSIYKDEVYLMYSKSFYHTSTSLEDFKNCINAQLEEAKTSIGSYYAAKENDKIIDKHVMDISQSLMDDILVKYDAEKGFFINELAAKNEIYKYKVYHQTYYVNKDGTGIKDGDVLNVETQPIVLNEVEYSGAEVLEIEKAKITKRPNFQKLLNEYVDVRERNVSPYGARPAEDYEAYFPIFKDAYELLGVDKLRSLKFRKSAVEDEVRYKKNMGSKSKMVVAKLNYKLGVKYSTKRIQEDLKRVNDELQLGLKTFKATVLQEWYGITGCSIYQKGSTPVKGYEVLRCKIAID